MAPMAPPLSCKWRADQNFSGGAALTVSASARVRNKDFMLTNLSSNTIKQDTMVIIFLFCGSGVVCLGAALRCHIGFVAGINGGDSGLGLDKNLLFCFVWFFHVKRWLIF